VVDGETRYYLGIGNKYGILIGYFSDTEKTALYLGNARSVTTIYANDFGSAVGKEYDYGDYYFTAPGIYWSFFAII